MDYEPAIKYHYYYYYYYKNNIRDIMPFCRLLFCHSNIFLSIGLLLFYSSCYRLATCIFEQFPESTGYFIIGTQITIKKIRPALCHSTIRSV